MKIDWRIELPNWIVIAAMFLLAAIAWPSAPDRMPIHWNAAGAVNGYGGRFEGLMLIPLVTTGIYLLLLLVPRIDPGRANYAQFASAYNVCRLAVLAFLGAFYALIIFLVRGHAVDVARGASVLIGGQLIVIGSQLGKVRPNWFFGIRTPWTLSSKLAWNKTHRLGGWMLMAGGVVMIASTALPAPWNVAASTGGLLVIGALLFIYSYFVWRSDPDKIPPAGTMPA
jgi:uncharacterized membrane protein